MIGLGPAGVKLAEVNARAMICGFAGHRWTTAADVHEAFPVLRCRRCGRLYAITRAESLPGRLRGPAEIVDGFREDVDSDRKERRRR
jgi:hypothetical protein